MNLFLRINHDKAINKILQEKKRGVSYQKLCQAMHWHCHITTANIMIIVTVIIVICQGHPTGNFEKKT